MTEFADEYVTQMQRAVDAFTAKVFPPDVMEEFERSSREDIAAGRNNCACHQDRPTFERLYPDGRWCCHECATFMFRAGMLQGEIVFDMREENT